MVKHVSPKDTRAHAGITCQTCHGVTSVTRDGNASYTLRTSKLPLPKLAQALAGDKWVRQIQPHHDLNTLPWPLEDDRFSKVVASHVMEHLTDLVGVMNEIHRVCQNGAHVLILTPHFSSPYHSCWSGVPACEGLCVSVELSRA